MNPVLIFYARPFNGGIGLAVTLGGPAMELHLGPFSVAFGLQR